MSCERLLHASFIRHDKCHMKPLNRDIIYRSIKEHNDIHKGISIATSNTNIEWYITDEIMYSFLNGTPWDLIPTKKNCNKHCNTFSIQEDGIEYLTIAYEYT